MNGFTVKQASAIRATQKSYKEAFDNEFAKCAETSSDLVSTLVGAGLGGGLGLLADHIRPADEDENRLRRRLTSLLTGAALGGVAGFGLNRFRNETPLLFPKKPSAASRIGEALDPDVSTVLAAGGLGYGLSPTLSRGGSIRGLFTPGAKELSGLNLTPEFFKNNPKIEGALKQYEAVAGGGKRLAIGKLLDKYVPKEWNPFSDRVANAAKAESNLLKTLKASKGKRGFQQLMRNAGLTGKNAVKPTAEGFAHNAAKAFRKASPHGRALRALALLIGGGAALYKGNDMLS